MMIEIVLPNAFYYQNFMTKCVQAIGAPQSQCFKFMATCQKIYR